MWDSSNSYDLHIQEMEEEALDAAHAEHFPEVGRCIACLSQDQHLTIERLCANCDDFSDDIKSVMLPLLNN